MGRPPTAPEAHDGLRVLVPGVGWPLETFVERLLVGLADRGLALTLRSRHRPPSAWLRTHSIGWAPPGGRPAIDALRGPLRRGGGEALRTTAALAAATRPRRTADPAPDVVYAPWLNALVDDPGLFDLGAPVVTSCRGALVTIAPWDPARPRWRDQLADVFARSARVHCVSHAILGDAVALGLDPDRATVIHPAVDPDAFRPRPAAGGSTTGAPRPARVAMVGSLIWRKDLEHGLLAVRRAIDSGADLRVDLVGDGPDAQHVRFLVDDLGLADRVRLHGRVPPADVAAVLGDADVLLHPSCAEGVSNAVLEAMATGLAVVTTDAGGMAEAVRDDVDGLVVPVQDADAMATALGRVASDAALRQRLGASARDRVVADFHLRDQVDAFARLLHDAAGDGVATAGGAR